MKTNNCLSLFLSVFFTPHIHLFCSHRVCIFTASSSQFTMSLLGLPNELIYMIASHLNPRHELWALSKTDRFLRRCFLPIIYRHNISEDKSSALSWAAENGLLGMVKSMIRHNAKLDTQAYPNKSLEEPYYYLSHNGSTPLHRAVQYHQYEMATLLLENGAPLSAFDHHTKTPFDLAVRYYTGTKEENEIIELMTKKVIGPNEDLKDVFAFTPFIEAVDGCHIELVRFFLGHAVNINLRSGANFTPLHLALQQEMPQWEPIAILLIERGAALELKDFWDQTPLHRALYNGHEKAVQLLLDKGANPNAVTSRGHTPIYYATRCFFPDRAQRMLKMLRDARGRLPDNM